MSSSRSFASLSSSLLARKGGARPAMRSALAAPGNDRAHDPLGDLGWDDMGESALSGTLPPPVLPAPVLVERGDEAIVVFEPVAAAIADLPAEPLLARKPAVAEVVQLVRNTPEVRPAAPAALSTVGQPWARRTRRAAFTLRLDPDRHFRLRAACTLQARSAQVIVTEAVDRFLDALPELEPLSPLAAAQRIA